MQYIILTFLATRITFFFQLLLSFNFINVKKEKKHNHKENIVRPMEVMALLLQSDCGEEQKIFSPSKSSGE